MSKSNARRERLGWLLTGIVVSAYVVLVAALGFLPRHPPELVANAGKITFPMGAALVFIAALVVVTSVYLHYSREEPNDAEQAAARSRDRDGERPQ